MSTRRYDLKKTTFPIQLQPGDKVFVQTLFNWKSPLSYLSACVRYFAKMKYNHVRVVSEYKGELMFIEAIEKGVEPTPIRYNPDKEKILVRRNHIPVDKFVYQERLRKIIHKKYDFWTLLVVELLWNTFNIWIGAKTEEEAMRRFICYEVLFYADQEQFRPKWWMFKPEESIYKGYTYTVFEDKINNI